MSASYWDTQNHRPLSESAAHTLMAPFLHELLHRAAGSRVKVSQLVPLLQRRSGIEVKDPEYTWLTGVLNRVDERCRQAGADPLSPLVVWSAAPAVPERKPAGRRAGSSRPLPTSTRKPTTEPLQGTVCPRCFMQRSLTGECANCD